jgi:hypothetical protein
MVLVVQPSRDLEEDPEVWEEPPSAEGEGWDASFEVQE